MTAVLNNIRQLEAEYRRGGLDKDDFVKTREYLMASVEDVEFVSEAKPSQADATERAELWHIVLFLGIGSIVCTMLANWLFGDLTLALTLTTTLVAALAVRALQKLGD